MRKYNEFKKKTNSDNITITKDIKEDAYFSPALQAQVCEIIDWFNSKKEYDFLDIIGCGKGLYRIWLTNLTGSIAYMVCWDAKNKMKMTFKDKLV